MNIRTWFMKINRQDLLQRLLSVECGINHREGISQSGCVVFLNKRIYTFSEEIAASIPAPDAFDKETEGAVSASELIALLRLVTDEELDFEIRNGILLIQGSKRLKVEIPIESKILLPISSVELPITYQKIPHRLMEALNLARNCTKKADKEYTKECIHICPNFVEASDNFRYMRYEVKSSLAESILIRGESIRKVIPLGMTRFAETASWLHFKNSLKLRVSVRKWLSNGSYPDHSEFAKMRGKEFIFPKGLNSSVEIASVMANNGDSIQVSIADGIMSVVGESTGRVSTSIKVKDQNLKVNFRMPPKLITEVIEKSATAEITPFAIRIAGEQFVFIAALEMVGEEKA
jgi:hypothetical protein